MNSCQAAVDLGPLAPGFLIFGFFAGLGVLAYLAGKGSG